MAISSLPQDTAAIVNEVELFFDSLPAKRRRARVEVCDEPETENYAIDAPEPDAAALREFRKLLRQLGQARSDVVAQLVELKIYTLLGLEPDK